MGSKQTGLAILISDKIDFKATKIKRDKKGYYIVVKGSMQQEELMILNIYHPKKAQVQMGSQLNSTRHTKSS